MDNIGISKEKNNYATWLKSLTTLSLHGIFMLSPEG